MFDVGFPEILLTAAIALIVIGPKDLLPLMRKLGGAVRHARQWVDQAKTEVMTADLSNKSDAEDQSKQARYTTKPPA